MAADYSEYDARTAELRGAGFTHEADARDRHRDEYAAPGFPAELERLLELESPDADPVHTEIHECLRILRRLEPLLEPLLELVDELPHLRPLLDAYKRTNGGTVGMLSMRRAMRNGH